MLNTFKYLALALVRNKGMMVWTLFFPLILMTCFLFMFAGLDNEGQIEPIPVIVVEDEAYQGDEGFQAFIESISTADASRGDEEPLLDVAFAATHDDALAILADDAPDAPDYAGIVELGENGRPEVVLARLGADATGQMRETYQSILLTMMDTYASRHELIAELAENNPAALTRPVVLEALGSSGSFTRKVTLTQSAPKESVRYYFALLGFAAVMGAQTSLIAVLWLLPRTSALGARRAVGGVSRVRSLAGTLAACWFVSFLCLVVAYLYLRFVVGVDFAGRDLECLGALAAASVMATSLGSAIAVLPKINDTAKGGLLTALVCIASLFAGLYGQPTMRLADTVAAACPASQWVNPAVQVSQSLFSLLYYDTLAPYFAHIVALLIMAAVFFACSSTALRRQRYASL